MEKREWKVIGLMSGTSLDGVDVAIVSINEERENIVELIDFFSYPYSTDIRNRLMEISDPNVSMTRDLSVMNMLLGEIFAEAVIDATKAARIPLKEIDLISSHGQTVFHQPEEIYIGKRPIKSTLQIGDIAVIAERTGVPVVGDFRTRDMAAGGQGAPLVPYADYFLLRDEEIGRVAVNIGGIANITVLAPNCHEAQVIAYDTGPGNMLMDLFANWITNGHSTYDKDGQLASQGNLNKDWFLSLLNHRYFAKKYPKSTGREEFGKELAKQWWEEAEERGIAFYDRICTITHLTAITIANEINRFIQSHDIKEVLISGGGVRNLYLLKTIQNYLPNFVKVHSTDEAGLNSDAKEAIIFALLGYQCMNRKTNNLPVTTGAKNPVVMGKIAW
ncbi:anhydro-N-acetylmuramic acid kinase [Bacillus kwashiorkori]|uniref:anhydro-N-acetylmuramic acid kinase n=1 Tax=Bacillus kwashiorkori TaxID=1522318 RepID=UPI000784749A|nr:anhydro-N-acetylmuramic acid kinase [Bacillus kwashiorkori]